MENGAVAAGEAKRRKVGSSVEAALQGGAGVGEEGPGASAGDASLATGPRRSAAYSALAVPAGKASAEERGCGGVARAAAVAEIMGMGFSQHKAEVALKVAGGNVERAINYLLSA